MSKKSHRKLSKGTYSQTLARRKRARNNKPIIQAIAVGVIAVVAIAIIWSSIASNKADKAAQSATPHLVGTKEFSGPPPMLIDQNKQYFANVKMARGGEFVIELYPKKAPITVNSFVFLARNGFFDGVTFHRVLEGFMAQGGDPTGTGSGGPGYEFVDEFSDLQFDKAGVLAMANSGANTNGSQFFITYAPTSWLNGKHTIFGQVTSGMDVVNSITLRDPSQNPDYPGDMIESITITEQ